MLPSQITGEVTGASVPSTPTSSPSGAELGREDFLRMLVAQLENQDPLNPQDGTEFTAQLAQFSSLEQLIAMRTSIDALTGAEASRRVTSEALAAAGLIGRDVLAESDRFEVPSDGALPPLALELAEPADSVSVTVRDAFGNRVAGLDLGALAAGRSDLDWDGTDSRGRALAPGLYRLEVSASAELDPVPATSLLQARVTGTDLAEGEARLRLGPLAVPLSGLREVREAAEAPR